MNSKIVTRLITAAVISVACLRAGSALAVEAPAGSAFYVGTDLDIFVLSRPRPSDLVIFDGRSQRFAADGASTANVEWQTSKGKTRGKLFIETQRRGLDRVEAGIASVSTLMVDEGLKAIEWGLQASVMGPDASFPDQRDTDTAPGHAIHPKSEFVEAAAHTVILIRQSTVPTAALKARANALVPSIRRAAQRMIDSGDAASFFTKANNSNQMAFIATALFEAGYVANDSVLVSTGNAYMQQVLSKQWSNGVYPEKEGFDTGYHMVTVELVTTYSSLVTDQAWRSTLMSANMRAVDWFTTRVRPNGSINTRSNTRTMACGKPIPGTGPKGPGIDRLAIRLYYHAYMTGQLPTIGPMADSIQTYGQDYDHINTCTPMD